MYQPINYLLAIFGYNNSSKVENTLSNSVISKHSTLFLTGLIACLFALPAAAFDDLNEPQTLIYDTSHLENTRAGITIAYEYTFADVAADVIVEDEVLMSINKDHENAHRDVSVNFLTEERKIHLPNFKNRRGNPVIIGMLEHLAQAMGRETGGGALYFRNRIRDKLADDNLEITHDGNIAMFSFSPFENDPYIADRIALTESVITIAFSDKVPGQLVSIEYMSGPSTQPESTRKLVFSNAKQE